VQARQRGSVHVLPGSKIVWGRRDMEKGLNYRYNAQLDGRMASSYIFLLIISNGLEQ